MKRTRKDLVYLENSRLPPPKVTRYERSKYVVLPTDLYTELEKEAVSRNYRTREFIIAILSRALNIKES